MMNFAFKKFCSKKSLENKQLDSSSTNSTTFNKSTNSGGRPKGTSIVNQHNQQKSFTAAKNKIASIYQKEKERCKKNGEKLTNIG